MEAGLEYIAIFFNFSPTSACHWCEMHFCSSHCFNFVIFADDTVLIAKAFFIIKSDNIFFKYGAR